MDPLVEDDIRRLADDWYRKLDEHAAVKVLQTLLAEGGFGIRVPEGTFHGGDGFRRLYEEGWTRRFFDEAHRLEQLSYTPGGIRRRPRWRGELAGSHVESAGAERQMTQHRRPPNLDCAASPSSGLPVI